MRGAREHKNGGLVVSFQSDPDWTADRGSTEEFGESSAKGEPLSFFFRSLHFNPVIIPSSDTVCTCIIFVATRSVNIGSAFAMLKLL